MQETSSQRSGFSVLEGLLAIAVLAVLGVSGWAVYQHVKQSATTTGATPNPNPASIQQTTTTPPQPIVAYLTIAPWGLKLPLTDATKDAYYVVSEDMKDGQPSAVWLGLKSLTNPTCDPANNNRGGRGAIGAIWRAAPTETDGVTGELLTNEYPNGTTIGNYYYFYQSWAAGNPCASASALQPADSAFASAAKAQITAATN